MQDEKHWYVAHVLLATELLEGDLGYYPVWENIYLIHAASGTEAWERAEELGHEEARVGSEGLTFDNQPARWRLVGVRNLIQLLEAPGDAAEVTWMQYSVKDKADLDRLIGGKPVCVVFEPGGPDEEGDAYHPELLR
ncbi:DUF4288 domain-containing protein [Armatimonas sp.]|uniref:DUF4288 domain-containing protein n=1 Tax=Armatimonas sp. TaxID=1872638 RepID=UPI00286CAB55|nr:DUF4288 domain-containing protein [Armatimonas sp.]